MKATMDLTGVITITPETGAEAYALRVWRDKNHVIEHRILGNFDLPYYRSEGLAIDVEAMKDRNA